MELFCWNKGQTLVDDYRAIVVDKQSLSAKDTESEQ